MLLHLVLMTFVSTTWDLTLLGQYNIWLHRRHREMLFALRGDLILNSKNANVCSQLKFKKKRGYRVSIAVSIAMMN